MIFQSKYQHEKILKGTSLVSGFAFKSSDFRDTGVPVIKIANIQGRGARVLNNSFVSTEFLTNVKTKKFIINNGDILIAMTGQGSVGRVGKILLKNAETPLLNQRVGKFICDQSILDRDYLYAVLTTKEYQQYLFSIGSGSGQPNLSPENILNVQIPLPPIDIQKNISSIINAIDNKIEINNQTNETLEALSKGLFKEWFVDFSPVKLKSVGGKTQGIEFETLNLFPDSFENTEMGEIPLGWSTKPLSSFIEMVGGLSYKGEFIGKGRPMVTMGCVAPDVRFNYEGLKHYSGSVPSQFNLVEGDIIISNRDITQARVTLGAPSIVPVDIGQGAFLATNMYKLVLKNNDISSLFLFEILRTKKYREQIIASAKGTTVLMLTKDALLSYQVVVPPKELMNNINTLFTLINKQVQSNTIENNYLTNIRSALIPKLISGEIELKD